MIKVRIRGAMTKAEEESNKIKKNFERRRIKVLKKEEKIPKEKRNMKNRRKR
jgi:hypothetical protein